MIVLYVDDLLITSGLATGLRNIKSNLSKEFSMIDVGLLRYFIVLEVNKKASGRMITQSIYIGYFLKVGLMLLNLVVEPPMMSKSSTYNTINSKQPPFYCM